MNFFRTFNFFISSVTLPISAYWWATGNSLWFLGLIILPGWILGYFHVKRQYCTYKSSRVARRSASDNTESNQCLCTTCVVRKLGCQIKYVPGCLNYTGEIRGDEF